MQIIRSADVSVVEIDAHSSVRLSRTQPHDRLVLWLPQHGWVSECLNGSPLVVEPGAAMLCLPGDDLIGDTSLHLKGFSILLPAAILGDFPGRLSTPRRHLHAGLEDLAVIHTARDLVSVFLRSEADPRFAIAALADQLLYWCGLGSNSGTDAAHPVDRRILIARAREWIEAHIAQPFRVSDLAAALHIAPRTLQLAFREEIGRTPMEEARRLRFLALRRLLLPPSAPQSLAELFARCGLVLSPLTKRRYYEWCGETPEQTRARAADACR